MHRDVAARIAREAREQLPAALLGRSGRVLYSPAATLLSDSPYYFLGFNPGVSPGGREPHDLLTIESDLDRLEADEIVGHAYLDEAWKGNPSGCEKVQSRAQELFAILARGDRAKGIALLRNTPASNMILLRSSNLAELKRQVNEKEGTIASWFWPFHESVIAAKQPRVILTHAIVIACALARLRGWGIPEKRFSGWGGTLSTLRAWRLPEGPVLLAIPNLSRYSPDGARKAALSAFFNEFGPG